MLKQRYCRDIKIENTVIKSFQVSAGYNVFFLKLTKKITILLKKENVSTLYLFYYNIFIIEFKQTFIILIERILNLGNEVFKANQCMTEKVS